MRRGERYQILASLLAWVAAAATGAVAVTAAAVPEESAHFSTVFAEERATISTASDGDLWPSCWADDGHLYAANGDGKGFSPDAPSADIAVSRIEGYPGALSGVTLAHSDAVGPVWGDPARYNRKPTGMVCVDGVLYLAVQDLAKDFDDAPAATICRSDDKGRTWTWDRNAPMFAGHVFTTIWFVDYGKNSEHATDGYVYAYGLDGNWRASFRDRVPDPTRLFLARVPKADLQKRSAWQFYAGSDAGGRPAWSGDIGKKAPVLEDGRRVYAALFETNRPRNMTLLSQGGVVYNKPLDRYLYTSWTEYTWEFYEAPEPWGPWKRFLSKDFGGYPWLASKNGGYAATIPSKFISEDGRTMYVQSNTFVSGVRNYDFSLRKLVVEPRAATAPSNAPDAARNLARSGDGTTPVSRTAHLGRTSVMNDGTRLESEDSWNNEAKESDWWGYVWRRAYRLNRVVFTSGGAFPGGGWFARDLKVQVRQDGAWVDAAGLSVTPAYPHDKTAVPHKTYTLTFRDTWGDGVRVTGVPGGDARFTSVSELEVYYAAAPGPR